MDILAVVASVEVAVAVAAEDTSVLEAQSEKVDIHTPWAALATAAAVEGLVAGPNFAPVVEAEGREDSNSNHPRARGVLGMVVAVLEVAEVGAAPAEVEVDSMASTDKGTASAAVGAGAVAAKEALLELVVAAREAEVILDRDRQTRKEVVAGEESAWAIYSPASASGLTVVDVEGTAHNAACPSSTARR